MQKDFTQLPQRLMMFLAKGSGQIAQAAKGDLLLIEADERGAVSVEKNVLDWLVMQGIVSVKETELALTRTGFEMTRALSVAREGQTGSRDLGIVHIAEDRQVRPVLANLSESPLGQLMRLRNKAGQPFLEQREFEAGERLRADYTRGQIMPRLGANWIASVASGKRSGAGGITELTDAALAARMRVEKAIHAVGPELSGVLIDVCCFLKGMEKVEIERAWPVRSGKIMLKSALCALARHYWPHAGSAKTAPTRLLHWGAQDYRPSLHGP
ncbi:DUF6456 domain-containing protein [Aquamicrobium segne]|uniref:DUF6456 domain-containing protein n=1 Tax=Aquamicrobium segne TaxID=469547 RepID=A0ABW0GWQ8_9HYPH